MFIQGRGQLNLSLHHEKDRIELRLEDEQRPDFWAALSFHPTELACLAILGAKNEPGYSANINQAIDDLLTQLEGSIIQFVVEDRNTEKEDKEG